jgi:hypothetical protein
MFMQFLTDMFHPKNKMKLNDAQCLLATYIFSPQLNQNIDDVDDDELNQLLTTCFDFVVYL